MLLPGLISRGSGENRFSCCMLVYDQATKFKTHEFSKSPQLQPFKMGSFPRFLLVIR